MANEIKFVKFNKNDPYIKMIPFYKTKNKLRDRVLITNSITNIIVFIKQVERNDPKINCKFSLYRESNKICHLLLISKKFIKKGELLCLDKEDLKIRAV